MFYGAKVGKQGNSLSSCLRHIFRNAVERLVEDMILQSMKRGDFNNLKGMGKPLKNDESNPYIDVIEYKLNKILINNGFAPPWIMKVSIEISTR